jgi:hypothetical protein
MMGWFWFIRRANIELKYWTDLEAGDLNPIHTYMSSLPLALLLDS